MRALLLSLLALVLAPPALAEDGRIEINQASVVAAGGFPLTISSPGNYVLTGDLAVPDSTQAILIRTTGVVLDLRGFQIAGPFQCGPAGCATGFVHGIGVDPALGGGKRSTVRGGSVRGFSGTCITLGINSDVSEMSVSSCGNNGIQVSSGSLVRANRIHDTGREGLVLVGEESGYFQNVIVGSGWAIKTPSSRGGTALGANFCDDGCAAPGRRFYLTRNSAYNGAQARAACVDGFHMASLWEILDPSDLRYDTSRGFLTEDSGEGPPSIAPGWIRTGMSGGGGGGGVPGTVSCSGYSVTTGDGTIVGLFARWEAGLVHPDSRAPWWHGNLWSCSNNSRVWCVED